MKKERNNSSLFPGKLDTKFKLTTLRGIAKIDEFASYLDQYNLRFVEEIKGFDPDRLFYNHMISVGIILHQLIPLYLEKKKEISMTLLVRVLRKNMVI
jgi:hypothetical protein